MKENVEGTKSEYGAGRFSNVGLLAIKALEQAIEACVAKEGLHLHEHPPTAHVKRREWLKTHNPDLVKDWDTLWLIYGELGYGGEDGKKAKRAVQTLQHLIKNLEERGDLERL
jgi:hypothetical protein